MERYHINPGKGFEAIIDNTDRGYEGKTVEALSMAVPDGELDWMKLWPYS